MKTVILTILFSISFHLTYSQDGFSKHSFHFFKNSTERKINVSEISILIDGEKILGEKVGEFYRFPKIDSIKPFEFVIKSNRTEFKAGPFKSWFLNNGSDITLGVLTQIDKLLSVAEHNGMEKNDENFDIYSKRFFIANDVYTVDINDYEKIKRLDYLIISPNQDGDGSYVLTQKIVELKK